MEKFIINSALDMHLHLRDDDILTLFGTSFPLEKTAQKVRNIVFT